MKKGQSMSLNVIIVAILALIVLVVLMAIFLGKIGNFNKVSSDCAQQANHICTSDSSCETTTAGDDLTGYAKDSSFTCKPVEEEARFCCVKIA